MASSSSRRKNAFSGSAEHASECLHPKADFPSPPQELVSTARQLESMGLISVDFYEFVNCCEPRDHDYLRLRDRTCRGQIRVDESMDDAGDEIRCPECERAVRYSGKQRFPALSTAIRDEGVLAFLSSALAELGYRMQQASRGLFRIDVGNLGVSVCVADYCSDQRCLNVLWASANATCYVVVDPRGYAERFLRHEGLTSVAFADLIVGKANLGAIVKSLADSGPPQNPVIVAPQVYSDTPLHGDDGRATQGRCFLVSCDGEQVYVNGVRVAAKQGGTRVPLFKILLDQFQSDSQGRLDPNEFRPWTLQSLGKELEKVTGRICGTDEDLRRIVNEMQRSFADTVRRDLGIPIDREDIIQTCPWKGQNQGPLGYRLNPFTVAIRPHLSAKTADSSGQSETLRAQRRGRG